MHINNNTNNNGNNNHHHNDNMNNDNIEDKAGHIPPGSPGEFTGAFLPAHYGPVL